MDLRGSTWQGPRKSQNGRTKDAQKGVDIGGVAAVSKSSCAQEPGRGRLMLGQLDWLMLGQAGPETYPMF